MIYPVITLHQPWATWIARGWKTIETREHPRFQNLKHKTILIHAGLTTDYDALFSNPFLTKEQREYKISEIVNGHIVSMVHVYDFALLNKKHNQSSLIDCENTKRFGLFLEPCLSVKSLFPIKVNGERGIWYYDLTNEKKVTKDEYIKQNL